MLTLIRSTGNMEAADHGDLIPKRRINKKVDSEEYYPCEHCKAYFMRKTLHRHQKKCIANNTEYDYKSSAVMGSTIFVARQKKYGKILNRLKVKEDVLANMRGDSISEEILNDLLIFSWGDDLYKKTANDRGKYHLVAKMRRCARFVVEMRKLNPIKYTDMFSCLRTDAFFDSIEATMRMSRYNSETRTFGAPSTALQFGAYLKQLAIVAKKLILYRGNKMPSNELNESLKNLKHYKLLIEENWTTELGSLAQKNLITKSCDKIPLLPITEDI